ncbi:hypothetical protein [Pseudoxanthomonas mexicana]|uniref:hypothetical protein n=1 Tax=Pseudoxanthomonas mexicana TaxID=128785 RepID=UPI0028AC19E1|nr:hypothetical protein [Pseudoxanthomonas mexicana]
MAEATTTEVAICSNALLRLGGKPINSFDEADPQGSNVEHVRLASNLWRTVRRQVLRAATWNCAVKRVLLSPDAEAPAFGFSYQFLRPSDWLRTIVIGRDECERLVYRMEGQRFLSNESALPLVYVFDNANPATWDASLIGAMELSMAQAMCYAVTGSTSLKSELTQELAQVLAQARNVDGQDEPAETLGDSPLFASRFGPGIPLVRR